MGRKLLTGLGVVVGILVVLAIIGTIMGPQKKANTASSKSASVSPSPATSASPVRSAAQATKIAASSPANEAPPPISARHVVGTATSLGAGTFTAGKDGRVLLLKQNNGY